MSIKINKVDTYIHRLYCESCAAEMKCTGPINNDNSETVWNHRCEACQTDVTQNQMYPFYENRPIEE